MTLHRSVLIALLLALVIALPVSAAVTPLADTWEWDWQGFRKFWRTQFGKTTGVVGATGVVVGIGVLIICSAKKKT